MMENQEMQAVDVFEYNATTDTAECELSHPIDGAMGLFLTVAGRSSDRFREAKAAQLKRSRALLRRYKTSDAIPEDEARDSLVEWVADIVTGWRVTPGARVKVPEFSRANLVRLMAAPHLLDQVRAFVDDDGNFMKASSKN